MPYGSGLAAQLMIAAESTVGTQVTVTKAYELNDESVAFDPTWLESQALKAGQGYVSAGRVRQSAFGVAGDITIPHVDRGTTTGGGMGLWWKHALGSTITTPTQIGVTTAYKQIHTPGFKTGLSLSAQVGRPQTDGTVRPFTFRGVKIPTWEFSVSDQGLAQLKLSVDGWQEDTAAALASATYPANALIFSFADAANFKIGGTPSTAAGETTISGGVTVATVATGVTITGSTGMATDRRGLGNAGVKREQIENAIPTVVMHLDGEFTQRTEFYDVFKSGATTALQLDFSQGDAGGGNPFLLSFILSACKIKSGAVNVGGPDILDQGIDVQAYSDGVNPVIQVKIVEVAQSAL